MTTLNKLKEAEKSYNKSDYHRSIEILRSLETALDNETTFNLHKNLMLKILEKYQKLKELETNDNNSLELGLLYLSFQNSNKANQIFISQIKQLNEEGEAAFNLGRENLARIFNSLGHYYYEGNPSLAISYFKKELIYNSDSNNGLAALSELLFRSGETKTAISYAKENINKVKQLISIEKSKANLEKSEKDIDDLLSSLNYYFDNLIMMLHYSEDISLEEIYLTTQEYYKNCIIPFKASLKQDSYSTSDKSTSVAKSDKVKVGFVSADLRQHALFYWLKDFLKDSNFNQSEIFLYHNHYEDSYSEIFKAQVRNWRNISKLNDLDAYRLIKTDQIDILIDLSGHTTGNRLRVFSLRAAPIQITWLGQSGPMGLAEIDHILVGENFIEVNEEKFYSEKVLRIPGFLAPYSFKENEIKPRELIPCLENSYISFGSANNMIKINNHVLEAWSAILHQVPHSKLLLKNQSLNDFTKREKLYTFFSNKGISPSRISMEGFSDRKSYLEFYNKIDIILDPFPAVGGTTSLDALSMGVPILTIYGKQMSHRGTACLNRLLGIEDFITCNKREYINRAVKLATEKDLIQKSKSHIIKTFNQSIICDVENFIQNFEKILVDLKLKFNKPLL